MIRKLPEPDIDIDEAATCDACEGSRRLVCGRCDGSGESIGGGFVCSTCKGSGRVVCAECEGGV